VQLDDLPQPERVTTVHPEELEVDGDNPNEQSDEMFGLLCENMRKKGWIGNHIITDENGLIADGEHRWRAAQEIGLEEVPVKFYDISDSERRLWRQELNKISGEHDSKRDALEYDYLLDSGHTDDVQALTDAADEDLDELLAEIKMDTSSPVDYEYDPEHNVYFEDCVEGMQERLEDDSVDIVFTSPPYNIDKEANGDRDDDDVVAYSDERSDEEFKQFLREVFTEAVRVVKPDGHIFVNLGHDYSESTIVPATWIREIVPAPLRSIIIWNKNTFNHGHLPDRGQFFDTYEPIYHFSIEESPLHGRSQSGVWDVPPANIEGEHYGSHPAPFSVQLVEKALQYTTAEGDTVLDPFMGSGTTAVAAIQNNRDYVGFEVDEEGAYKPIIERRIGEAKRQRDAPTNQG
jgi:DNA modification methylase